MKKVLLNIVLGVFCAALIGCNASEKASNKFTKSYTLIKEPVHKSLFFSGTIKPLRERPLVSPTDAVIESFDYRYGQLVKKGSIVATLSSSQLQKQYSDALTEYLKAKDNYNISRSKFTGTQSLWNSGLLSKNNFLSEKSSVNTARISLLQATTKLKEMITKTEGDNSTTFSALNIAEFAKVQQALTAEHNKIHVKAPISGILLYPPKSSEEKTGVLALGSSLKSGQLIGLIGDVSGLTIEIDVPEIDIVKIHTGMKAKVTGVALGNNVFLGELIAVNAQASTSSGNALPSFNATIQVKHLKEEERSWVKIGMSASIELIIEGAVSISIPIQAIEQQKNSSVVRVKKADGTIDVRRITTGSAEADRVAVESGLAVGEVVVYD